MTQLTNFYKFRHENSDAGLTEFIAGVLRRLCRSNVVSIRVCDCVSGQSVTWRRCGPESHCTLTAALMPRYLDNASQSLESNFVERAGVAQW